MFNNIYNGKKVFVTGHTGFKGSWLCAWLVNLGANVIGYSDDIPTNPSHFTVANLKDHITDVRGDIRDRENLSKTLKEHKPDIVFHLAAQALVRKSYDKPIDTFETNALGTMNILECIRNIDSVSALVMITSDKCYRNDEWVYGYRETDHLGGYDPYSASKACAEIIAHSYFKSFFSDGPYAATVRAGNVIGGGDWALDRIVPDCARAYSQNISAIIRNPWATRPWQHVLEPLSGYLWLGAKLFLKSEDKGLLRNEAFNFGPNNDVNNTVGEVVESLSKHWPNFKHEIKCDEKAPKECTLLKLCCDKAYARLSWKATLNFEETIRFTAEWYHRFYKGDGGKQNTSMLDFTLGQIKSYVNFAEMREQAWVK